MSEQPGLVLATRNSDKIRELNALFAGLPLGSIRSATEIGAPDVVEDGQTLEENALKKARELAAFSGEISVADDTGLEVEALYGAPGVRSARFAGDDSSYEDNCRKLSAELEGVGLEARGARFRTVMALVDPRKRVEISCDGELEGRIALQARGDGGFGYDPVFELLPASAEVIGLGFDAPPTLAQLSLEQKNEISHRGRAARLMRSLLEVYLRDYYADSTDD
jgi:XTP/dITP diphosphohydrolase